MHAMTPSPHETAKLYGTDMNQCYSILLGPTTHNRPQLDNHLNPSPIHRLPPSLFEMHISPNVSLFSPIRKLLGFFFNETPSGTEFREEELGVGIYLEFMELSYNSVADSKRLRVQSISIYKQRTLSRNEYVVVTAKHFSGVDYHFRIDRKGESRPPEPVSTSTTDGSLSLQEVPALPVSPSASCESQHWPSELSPSNSPMFAVPAFKDMVVKDTVLCVRRPKKLCGDCLLGTLTFPASPLFYLYHVIILADVLHKSTECYRQYHLAGAITNVFEQETGTKTIKALEANIPPRLRHGSWNAIGRTFDMDHAAAVANMDNLKAKFEAEVSQFEQRLVEKDMEEEEQKREIEVAKEAIKVAKEETRVAGEEAMVAKEETRVAGEKAMVAQEELRRLWEERARLKAELANFANLRLDE